MAVISLRRPTPPARLLAMALPAELLVTRLPFVENPASAGFPSPAGDYIESTLDLNEYLIRNKPATFLIRFAGDSLEDIGILDGDIGVVDRSINPTVGQVVIASVDDETLAKVLEYHGGRPALVSRNQRVGYPAIHLDKAQVVKIWGPVTGLVRRL